MCSQQRIHSPVCRIVPEHLLVLACFKCVVECIIVKGLSEVNNIAKQSICTSSTIGFFSSP